MFKPENTFISLLLSNIKRDLFDRKFDLAILDHPSKNSKGTEYYRISVFDKVEKREINFDTFENKFSTTVVSYILIGMYIGLEVSKLMARPMYNTKKTAKAAKELVTSR
jgi:hypothetical protein